MTDQGGIHDEHPFLAPVPERDPARRLRGRLAAPVTIITAGDEENKAGLTVSSLVIAEGDPARVYFLLSPTTDLSYAIDTSGRFVIHVCESRHRDLADVFAGLRPSPGGEFQGCDISYSSYGPVIGGFGSRADCSVADQVDETYSVLVAGTIDRTEFGEITDPLVYFRGRYRKLQ